jgi:hypothetical protein
MDGQAKQPRNPNDLIIFQNIDNEDHEWQYDAIRTPLPYYIRAGETRELPFYIARHGIEKLIDKMLLKSGKMHTSPLERGKLRDKIFLGIKHINYIREKTPNELALEAMQRKKDLDPYEELIKEREILSEQQAQTKASSLGPQTPLIQTLATPVAPATRVSNPENAVTPTQTALNNIEAPTTQADPERVKLYSLLMTKLHMDLNHQPTKEKLDATPVDVLKRDFASELPELVNPAAAIVPDTKESLQGDGMPVTPAQPTAPQIPVVPSAPQIPTHPQAAAAPLLDQQLAAAK